MSNSNQRFCYLRGESVSSLANDCFQSRRGTECSTLASRLLDMRRTERCDEMGPGNEQRYSRFHDVRTRKRHSCVSYEVSAHRAASSRAWRLSTETLHISDRGSWPHCQHRYHRCATDKQLSRTSQIIGAPDRSTRSCSVYSIRLRTGGFLLSILLPFLLPNETDSPEPVGLRTSLFRFNRFSNVTGRAPAGSSTFVDPPRSETGSRPSGLPLCDLEIVTAYF
jgi:hypothetical protein